MRIAGIKEIKTNPGLISKAVEDHQYLLISKRGKPIAIATSLDDEVFDVGLKNWIVLQAFKTGGLSLGQLSRALDKTYAETTKLLNLLKENLIKSHKFWQRQAFKFEALILSIVIL